MADERLKWSIEVDTKNGVANLDKFATTGAKT